MSLPRREPDDLIWLEQGIALVARIRVLLDRSARLIASAGAAAAATGPEPAARTDIAVLAPVAARRRHA